MSARPEPSPAVRAYLQAADRPRRSYLSMPLSQLRQLYRDEFMWGAGPPEKIDVTRDVDAGGIPARLYTPRGTTGDLLIWLHGGGWNLGSVDGHDAVCTALANRSNASVLSVDYRLAPEHPYPAALEDAQRATTWASRRFLALAVGGDSAGATLAITTARRARDQGLPLALQLLVYPVTDYRPQHPTYDAFRRKYSGFGGEESFGAEFQDTIADIWRQYIPNPAQREVPDASPLRAVDLAGVAPVYLLIAEHDILRPEEEEFAARLRQAKVPVTTDVFPGQIHGFFPLLRVFPQARQAVDRAGRVLKQAFEQVRCEASP